MLKIHKGVLTLNVSKGAYKSMYKGSGWSIVEPDGLSKPTMDPGPTGGANPPRDGMDPYNSPQEPPEPMSEDETLEAMSEDELKQYASLLGIKTKNIRSRGELMESIKAIKQ